MIIERFIAGPLSTNSYVLISGNEAVIIDSGGDMSEVIDFIKMKNAKPRFFIATHGHFDHVLGVSQLKTVFPSISFLLNERDLELVRNSRQTAARFGISISEIVLPDSYVREGDKIEFGEDELKILETPGHTMGSICILVKNSLFTGDTLFSGTVGRTDLGGSAEFLKRSLDRLKSLSDDLIVYPGHGEFTYLGYEKISNPFLTGEIEL